MIILYHLYVTIHLDDNKSMTARNDARPILLSVREKRLTLSIISLHQPDNVNTVDFVIYCFYRCFTDCNFCECIKMYYIFSTLLSSAFFVSYHWIFKCVRILWVVYCMMLHEQTIQTLLLMQIFLRNMSNKQKSMSFLCKIEWNCQK